MTDFTNVAEVREHSRQQRVDAKRALWAGRKAFGEGKDGVKDNPFDGWQSREDGLRTFQCVLWCRWLYGWLVEFHQSPERRGDEHA